MFNILFVLLCLLCAAVYYHQVRIVCAISNHLNDEDDDASPVSVGRTKRAKMEAVACPRRMISRNSSVPIYLSTYAP